MPKFIKKLLKFITFVFTLYVGFFIYGYMQKDEILNYMRDELIKHEIKYLKENIQMRAIASGKSEEEVQEILKSYEPIFTREKDKFYKYCSDEAINSQGNMCYFQSVFTFNYLITTNDFYLTYSFDDETIDLHKSLFKLGDYKKDDKFYLKYRKEAYSMFQNCMGCSYEGAFIIYNYIGERHDKSVSVDKKYVVKFGDMDRFFKRYE